MKTCNHHDYGCKITVFLSIGARKKVISVETTFYFDVGQKMPIRASDQQQTSKMLVAFGPNYNLGPAATRALPASLPSYFLKFLMKRAAKSSAFLFHSAASA